MIEDVSILENKSVFCPHLHGLIEESIDALNAQMLVGVCLARGSLLLEILEAQLFNPSKRKGSGKEVGSHIVF